MSNSFNSNYTLDVLQLVSRTGGMIDLVPYFTVIEIYEDIYSPLLYGRVDVVETKSIIETLPLRGDEFVFCSLRLHGAHNATPKYIFFYMDIITVENEETYRHKGATFTMQLISQSFKQNMKTRDRRWHFPATQDAVVKEIVEFQLQKPVIRTDPCMYEEQYIFPNWHPLSCVNKLKQNSISARYMDSDYVFYEDLKGFNYVSMSYLADPANSGGGLKPSTADSFKAVIITDVNDTKNDYNIESYHKKRSFDSIENHRRGMYGTTLIYNDPVNRKWDESKKGYFESFLMNVHNAHIPLTLIEGVGHEKNKMMYQPMNGVENPGVYTDEYYQEQKQLLALRQMQFEHNAYVLEFNGEPNLEVGKVFKWDLISMKDDDKETKHDTLNGFFLITKIRHQFLRESYKQYVEVAKDSYEK